jgi:hypothetical protein
MSVTYTFRVNTLKALANFLGGENKEKWISQLDNLRRSSDTMELVGHPKNPNLLNIRDNASDMFDTFRVRLSTVKMEILSTIEERSSLDVARRVATFYNKGTTLSELKSFCEKNIKPCDDSISLKP